RAGFLASRSASARLDWASASGGGFRWGRGFDGPGSSSSTLMTLRGLAGLSSSSSTTGGFFFGLVVSSSSSFFPPLWAGSQLTAPAAKAAASRPTRKRAAGRRRNRDGVPMSSVLSRGERACLIIADRGGGGTTVLRGLASGAASA